MTKTEWYQHPLVSALMVCSDPLRREFAEKAIGCFLKQRWPLKEMVLINSTGRPFFIHPLIREFIIKTRSLGEAKNLALYNSDGEWCLPWHDDSAYHEDYVMFHMAQKHPSIPTVMAEVNAHVLTTGNDTLIDDGRFTFGCFPRLCPYTYRENGEESEFFSNFEMVRKIKHLGGPLVTKFFADEQ
jgi:hypothetical protein